jgi:hypothetical protein
MIGGTTWAGEHLPRIIGAVFDFIAGGNGLNFVLVIAQIPQIPKGNQGEAVTGRTNLAVNLKAPLQLVLIKFPQGP